MALSGIFLSFGYAGVQAAKTGANAGSVPVLANIFASENLTTSGTSATIAPATDSNSPSGKPIGRVYAVADSIISFGETPNASSPRRAFVPAGETMDFGLNAGDKIFWVAA